MKINILVLLLSCLIIQGCGVKGPLRLPEKTQANQQTEE